jgi:hypothetical protein
MLSDKIIQSSSARDRSGKPAVRNERGLVTNSPVAPRQAAKILNQ